MSAPQHITQNGVTRDAAGWYSATCACGALSPSVPDLETLADVLMEHAAAATLSDNDPRWVEITDGRVALHIHSGGNAVIVDSGPGEGDITAFREWLQRVWPQQQERS